MVGIITPTLFFFVFQTDMHLQLLSYLFINTIIIIIIIIVVIIIIIIIIMLFGFFFFGF